MAGEVRQVIASCHPARQVPPHMRQHFQTGQIQARSLRRPHLLSKRRERIVTDGFHKLLDNPEIVETLLQRQTSAPSPFKISYKGRALRVIAATIHSKDGTPIGSAALLRDITPVRES